MCRCYLRGGRICQASPPTCPSWTGRMDDDNKLIIIIAFILYRCTIYGPLGIFKSPVAPFVLLFRLSTECPFLLPRAKPLYFIKNISRTSAVSSTNFRSILIFARCVVGTCNILRSTSLYGRVFIRRGPISCSLLW